MTWTKRVSCATHCPPHGAGAAGVAAVAHPSPAAAAGRRVPVEAAVELRRLPAAAAATAVAAAGEVRWPAGPGAAVEAAEWTATRTRLQRLGCWRGHRRIRGVRVRGGHRSRVRAGEPRSLFRPPQRTRRSRTRQAWRRRPPPPLLVRGDRPASTHEPATLPHLHHLHHLPHRPLPHLRVRRRPSRWTRRRRWSARCGS